MPKISIKLKNIKIINTYEQNKKLKLTKLKLRKLKENRPSKLKMLTMFQ